MITVLELADEFLREGKYPESLLDIGCGPCFEGEDLISRGIALTGIDQDEETVGRVQERLPEGRFITADAAVWLRETDSRYDAVLVRRPDLIFRSQNWHAVFQRIPLVLDPDGMVIVTTPGQSEAGMCEKWLRETADKVSVSKIGHAEEAFLVKAEEIRKTDEKGNDMNSLIQSLSWEDDQPHMVCDLRTGLCTVVTDKEKGENKNEDTEKE